MIGVTAFGIQATAALLAAFGAIQYIDVESGWRHETRGPWSIHLDRRALLAMHHPWEQSAGGNFAMALGEVTVPGDWEGPIRLGFYCSDDFHTIPGDPAAANLAADGFVGHRRKQILVNDALVWSADVSDPVYPGISPYYQVDLPAAPGSTVRIALVAYDTAGSAEPTRDDFYRPPAPGITRESDPDATRFRTTVYWGDLALVSGDTIPAARPRPSERLVLERHNAAWPPSPKTDAWKGKTIELALSSPAALPAAGFPLEMGLPMPEGLLSDPSGFRLRSGGASLYAQKSISGTWLDGSPRWVQVRFPVTPGMKSVSLSFRPDSATPRSTIRVREAEGEPLGLDTGSLSLNMGVDPISNLRWKDRPAVELMRLTMDLGGDVTPGTGDQWRVEEVGPFCVRAVLEGRFEGLSRSNGRFELHASVYEGLPYVKLWLRVFNDTPGNLDISHLLLESVLPEAPESVTLPHGAVTGDFTLAHPSDTAYQINGEQHESTAPFFVAWKGAALAVKHFRALFPKAVGRSGKVISIDLVAGGNAPVSLTPGEALSHEIWLALGNVDGPVLAGAVERPPVLQNRDYSCSIGATGPAAPLPEGSPCARHLDEHYGDKTWSELGQTAGLRHFPDAPYGGVAGSWCNDYDGRMMGLWTTWLMTGDRRWFDRAVAVSEHVLDVAIVHAAVPGKDWLGALHGPGPNHVAGPWSPALDATGIALFGHITGNPGAQDAFLGVADFCVRSGAGLKGANARQMAGPFATICTAYQETGEIAFLEAGAERLTAMLSRVDRRRGVWFDWHGSEVYPGNVPWMVARLAQSLYAWYQATGDVEAAQMIVGLAEAVASENAAAGGPGMLNTYSPNPRFGTVPALAPGILPLYCAAHELTGDPYFLEAARALWEQWSASPAFQPVFTLPSHWLWVNACVADFPAPDAAAPSK